MLIIFTGFQGLIGYNYELSLACFLIGCNFANILMGWPDQANPVIYRKITLVLYLIMIFMFFLFFINFSKEQRYSSYLSAIYVTVGLFREQF